MALAVVDASVVAAILFAEPEAKAMGERLRGEDLAAPSLLPFEVANVAAVELRRGSASRRALEAGLEAYSRLGIALYPANPSALVSLAARTGLTAYDAAYLWLADSLVSLKCGTLTDGREVITGFVVSPPPTLLWAGGSCLTGSIGESSETEDCEGIRQMIQIVSNTQIYQPIKRVFDFISTPENDFQWQYGTLATASLPEGVSKMGSFFRSVGHLVGRRVQGTFEVTEYEPNRKYGFKTLSGPFYSRTSYTFKTADGGTRITISTRAHAVDFFQMNELVLEKKIKKSGACSAFPG